jgi:hypothetical protein
MSSSSLVVEYFNRASAWVLARGPTRTHAGRVDDTAADAQVSGVLIAESIRIGVTLDDLRLGVQRIRRLASGDVDAGQPPHWTLIDFTASIDDASSLAESLSSALDTDPAWYADFRSACETFVIFPGRVFRYPRGSDADRAEAVAHGRDLGIPASQLDWPV